ncbi:NUDIX hydrolase [Dietzia cinnamea]|uniref:NUDIX domain-containing protein n=1 Tax=Dietzia cinnamea TaxID=321318 RepID=A0A4V6P4K3_9ACTN|nr:NUDIX domain-containing protein [Dietzia cinnamea]TCW24607.1 NUDIX domain-containing protein [Dietzia cinnamea]
MTSAASAPRIVRKVVGYVVHEGRLLVFTHDGFPLVEVGVQVPAGTIEHGESPEEAAVREVAEETGIRARVVRSLGTERYDMRPSKPEIHERHFFHLEPEDLTFPERWPAGEPRPSGGGERQEWTCFWIPVERAHVLCAGCGARVGELAVTAGRRRW